MGEHRGAVRGHLALKGERIAYGVERDELRDGVFADEGRRRPWEATKGGAEERVDDLDGAEDSLVQLLEPLGGDPQLAMLARADRLRGGKARMADSKMRANSWRPMGR